MTYILEDLTHKMKCQSPQKRGRSLGSRNIFWGGEVLLPRKLRGSHDPTWTGIHVFYSDEMVKKKKQLDNV